jgi:O-antigen/teichoic acid export membrane protein
MNLDVFLLKLLRLPEDVGQYGMAKNLAFGITLLTAALSTVLLPKLVATRRKSEMKRIVGIFMKATPFLASAVACVIVAAHLLVPRFMVKYTPALPVFDMLAVAYTISVVVTPLSFLCLAWKRARWLTWMNLAQLLINAGMSLLLIPYFGAMGAGVSALLVRLFALVFLGLAYRRLLKLADKTESVDSSPQASHTHSV